jgi:benzoyl-CoA reductase/2-hydroxyglutaryl-CoA dehydratase subunit BcrC/BadD/HgdB
MKNKWFEKMILNCLDYARRAKAAGKHIVGITCEYTPRELIIAADAIPVCLCGGSAETITPAERDLPVNLCPLIKSTYGYHVTKANPFLEMADLAVVETTCDGKKKMYELMALSRDVRVLELPQKPDQRESLAYWKGQFHKLKSELEKRFNVTITNEKIKKAIRAMNHERALRRKLSALMASDNPPLTGRQLLDLRTVISPIEKAHEQYESILKLLSAKSRKNSNKGKIRVLLTGVPVVHGAERVVDLIEDAGGLIVCMDNCTGLKPIIENVDCNDSDPIEALARKYLHLPCSVMTRNDLRLDMLDQMVGQYRPDCIIELIWQNCLTYEVESFFIKRFADAKGLPYLKIETDYSPSDSARIKLRVEALFETVRLTNRKKGTS